MLDIRNGPSREPNGTIHPARPGASRLAGTAGRGNTMSMYGITAYEYVFGPIVAVAAIGLFVLVLKWANRRGTSLVAARPRRGAEDEYGMLVPLTSPTTYIEGEIQRRTLEEAGIRANLVYTLAGPRVMVWPDDERRARELIAQQQR